MPLFYISFQRGDQISHDDEGQDLPGLEEARATALASARELVADQIKAGTKTPLDAVIITNDRGEQLMRIPAKEVLPEPLK